MGDQAVKKIAVLTAAIKALSYHMASLIVKVDDINNNNNKNQNKRCGPISVRRGRNNRIIEDSSSSKVEKIDFEEKMSNYWKKLQILREQAYSAKSIEKDQKARSKAIMETIDVETIDVDHFIEEKSYIYLELP